MREAYADVRSTRPRPSSRPVVVLLGSCPGFNLQPRSSRLIALGSPWFGTFADAADALAATLPADATLILRPHPADVEGQRYSRRPDAPGLLVPEGSIRDLVAHADVVAVLGSTRTQVEVALLDVPIVLLSRSVLWGQGIAFEFDGQDLSTPVRLALAGERAEARRAATDRLIDFLASTCLFGLPASGVSRGPDAFARFLGRFHLPGAAGAAVAERLERFSARVAPLLATYVCREVSVAQRPMHPVLEPYLEAHLVDLVVRDGTVSVAVCGTDAVGRRLAAALRAQGVSVEAFVDPDGNEVGRVVDGVPVIGLDDVPTSTASAVVIASHAHEASLRARLRALPLGGPARLFGPAMTVHGDDDSLSRHEAPERLWMARATHHASRQDWPAALAALEAARRARPDAPEPWHREAILARTMGARPPEVWAACRRALELGGRSFDILLDAGFAAFASGDMEAAEGLAREAATMRPDASPPWHLRGLCARGRGAEPAAVLSLLERALAGTPVTAELALDAAGTALALGQVARADTLARRAAAERPSWPLPRHLLALCARARGASTEEVGFWIAEALARPPVSAELAYDAASLAHGGGDVVRGEELASLAAELKPGWSAPWYLLGLCRRARGAPAAEIHDAFTHGLAAEPRTLELVIDAGFAALDAGDPERADALAREAHALQPQWSVPWHLRAVAARASGLPQVQVLELLYRGMRCGDASAELAFDAASVAYALRRNADAARYITQALELRPDWPDALALQRRLASLATPPHGAPS
jgi:tetratricopeptide (TPR) repeat protein